MQPSLRSPWFVSAAYAVITLIRALRHGMWRDEVQAWMLARDATSLADLFHNMRCEGHPALWHLCLFALSRGTSNPIAMQVFHVCVTTFSAFLILRHAPFRWSMRIATIAGYLLSFEYGVISRSYGLGVLLLVALCVELAGRRRTAIVGGLVFLGMQTSFFMALVILALSPVLLTESTTVGAITVGQRRRLLGPLVTAAVIVASLGVLVAQVLPSSECEVAGEGWRIGVRVDDAWRASSNLWRAYAPIPGLTWRFWGTHILGTQYVVQTFLGLPFVLAFAVSFRRSPAVALAYVGGSLGIVLFNYARYHGAIRHHGHLFLLLGACCWLATAKENAVEDRAASWFRQLRFAAFALVLVLQMPASVAALVAESRLAFSSSALTARWLRRHGLADARLIGLNDQTSAVAGYLRGPVYYAHFGVDGTFLLRGEGRIARHRHAAIEDRAFAEADRTSGRVVILTNAPLSRERPGVTLVANFSRCIVIDECFWVYLREPLPAETGAHRGE